MDISQVLRHNIADKMSLFKNRADIISRDKNSSDKIACDKFQVIFDLHQQIL